ncbi:ABC transporter permease [Vulcanisaeta sp. JCM 14467]|uniref:ABC transporter permease n=1 Tax=Vulcanisaeta sp. JCM 14467 TaxID=1295370 RepID=UPI0006D20745|nr:ABC transporter permease [Vulcanisaeta sp. JCM 14467]
MGLARTLAVRAATLVVLLFIVLFVISFALAGPASKILKDEIMMETKSIIRQLMLHGHYNSTQIQQLQTQIVTELENAYGLNKPPAIRTLYIMYNMIVFNWGYAYFPSEYGNVGGGKVVDIILSALPGTILLDTFGILLSAFIGIEIGLRSALKYGSKSDRAVMYYAALSNGIPQWWLGIVMLLVFSFYLAQIHSPIYFPTGGIISPRYYELWLTDPIKVFAIPQAALDLLWHLILPLVTVLIINIGGWAYFARTVVLNISQEDFVTFAKIKGLPEGHVVNRYILRPAAPSILTSVFITIPFIIFGGFLVTEMVFHWWGLGYVYNIAIVQSPTPDLPVVVALTYASTLLYIVIIFIMEIVYIMLDPRLRE